VILIFAYFIEIRVFIHTYIPQIFLKIQQIFQIHTPQLQETCEINKEDLTQLILR